MKILTPEQFQKCPRGTVFAYGPRWAFGPMLILDSIMIFDSAWGFYAIDPVGVDAHNSEQHSEWFKDMDENGASYPVETGSTKYMNYDGDDMDVFLVFERSDWETLTSMVTFPDDHVSQAAE